MLHKRVCLLVVAGVAALVSVSPLRAGDGAPKWMFGARASLAGPVGPFSDASNNGLGLTLFAERRLTERMAYSISVDYVAMGGKESQATVTHNGAVVKVPFKIDLECVDVMLDYYFRLRSNDCGSYMVLGAGLASCTVRERSAGMTMIASAPVSLGIGYNFSRNLGAEARYIHQGAKVELMFPTAPTHQTLFSATVQYLTLGAHYRF